MSAKNGHIASETPKSSDSMTKIATRQEGEVEEVFLDDLGYVPTYRRAFSTFGSFCLTVAITSPVSALLVIATYQVNYGGYWGFIWGWVIPGLIFAPQAMAVSMLASSMPVNGAFYWYSAALAPPKWSRFISFLTGWTTILSGITSIASFSYAIASPMSLFISVLQPQWTATPAQQVGMTFAIVVLWVALACLRLERITWLVTSNAAITMVLSIVFMVGIPTARAVQHLPFANAKDVFGTYQNFSDWDDGLAACITFLASAWVVSAWPLPAYSPEGTRNAATSTPKAIMSSYWLMVLLGMVMCIICAFSIPDIAAAAADETGYPLYTLIYETWGIKAGSAFLFITSINLLVGASSMLFSYGCNLAAFARDGGVPFPDFVSKVALGASVPVNATIILGITGMLCLIIGLSPAASNIIYSLSVVMAIINYLTPNILVLLNPKRFIPGPFHYGRFSIPVFALATASQIFLILIESVPGARDFDASTFNYQWVIALAVMILVCLMWPFVGKRYTGVSIERIESHIAASRNQ